MSTLVARLAPRRSRLRAAFIAWMRAQRLALGATALCRNQLVVCASTPLQFAPDRPAQRRAQFAA
jgi:hypothetical protein